MITTRCPACNNQTLFVDPQDALHCAFLQCPNPTVATSYDLVRNVAFLPFLRLASFGAINQEAIFQAQRMSPTPTQDETIALLQQSIAAMLADRAVTQDEVRKVAAACLLCMETNGVKERTGGAAIAAELQ